MQAVEQELGKNSEGSMLAVGFAQSANDACLYILEKGDSFVHAVIHVDDFAIFNNDSDLASPFGVPKHSLWPMVPLRYLRMRRHAFQ